jgi:hypothetical protein
LKRAMFRSVIFNHLEYPLNRLRVDAVYLLLPPAFAAYEIALFKGPQVMTHHTLFLVKGFCDIGYVHGVLSKRL